MQRGKWSQAEPVTAWSGDPFHDLSDASSLKFLVRSIPGVREIFLKRIDPRFHCRCVAFLK
jgi:hypothetical protein